MLDEWGTEQEETRSMKDIEARGAILCSLGLGGNVEGWGRQESSLTKSRREETLCSGSARSSEVNAGITG